MIDKRDVPTVKAKVTASHVYGRRCTEINKRDLLSSVIDSHEETIFDAMDEQIAIVIDKKRDSSNKNWTPKRGFQHLYRLMMTATQ